MTFLSRYQITEEEFKDIVEFFSWLRLIRNSNTRKEIIELTYRLQKTDNELEEVMES